MDDKTDNSILDEDSAVKIVNEENRVSYVTSLDYKGNWNSFKDSLLPLDEKERSNSNASYTYRTDSDV